MTRCLVFMLLPGFGVRRSAVFWMSPDPLASYSLGFQFERCKGRTLGGVPAGDVFFFLLAVLAQWRLIQAGSAG